jgi:hypothetical protein
METLTQPFKEYGTVAGRLWALDWWITNLAPRWAFGFELGNQLLLGKDVVIIKAGGVLALATDWLPPSSDGGMGAFNAEMIQDIQDSLARADVITGRTGQVAELSGLVWLGFTDTRMLLTLTFEVNMRSTNLENLLRDIRSDLSLPNLPIICHRGMNWEVNKGAINRMTRRR